MGWSLRAGPEGSGSSPRCGLRRLQGAGRTVRGSGGPAAPAPPPRSPPPTTRLRPDGSRLLVQAPAFRWFGPLTQPPCLSGVCILLSPRTKGWDSETSGKGTKIEGQIRDGAESRHKERKGGAEDFASAPASGEKVWGLKTSGLLSRTQQGGRREQSGQCLRC